MLVVPVMEDALRLASAALMRALFLWGPLPQPILILRLSIADGLRRLAGVLPLSSILPLKTACLPAVAILALGI